jgi:hypothetical protein
MLALGGFNDLATAPHQQLLTRFKVEFYCTPSLSEYRLEVLLYIYKGYDTKYR